jgi:hypothetical protein
VKFVQAVRKAAKEQDILVRLENCKEIAKIGKGFIKRMLRPFEFTTKKTRNVCIHELMEKPCPFNWCSSLVSKEEAFLEFANLNAEAANYGLLSEEEVRRRYPYEYHLLKHHQYKTLAERFDEICMEYGLFRKRNEAGVVEWVEYESKENLQRVFCHSLTIPSNLSVIHTKRLSKSQICQLLLYHFMHPDERGILSMVSEKEVADMLGCHVKTVRANNEFFEKIGIIFYSKADNGRVNIWLRDYNTYHLNKEKGGEGYIPFSKQLLSALLCIEDVNVLRVELQKLIKYDNDNIKFITKTDQEASRTAPSTLTCDEIKKVVPYYLRYNRAVMGIVSRSSEAFETNIEGSVVVFKLKERYNGKIIKREQKEKRYEEIKRYLASFFPQGSLIEAKQIEDLVQMSFEYGLQRVKNAIKEAEQQYGSLLHTFNLGGMVRTIIRDSYLKKSS